MGLKNQEGPSAGPDWGPTSPDQMETGPDSSDGPDIDAAELDRLGRQRPAVFPNIAYELFFCASLLVSMFMAEFFISGFNIILPSSFLLPFGRLADIHGAYVVFNAGLIWFAIWSLISGFSTNYQMLIVARALGGLGPAAFLPTSIMLLGKTYRPGPRKNLVFSLWSAFAPIGFFLGIITGGAATEYLSWRCTRSENAHIRMDYWGVVTVVPGLILTTFAITEGGHAPQGWRTPYILVTFLLGILFIAAAVYVEGWVAKQPLLPFDLFKPKYMARLSVALLFAYGTFGIYLFYASFHIGDYMGESALTTAIWFAPMAAGGLVLATIGGFTLHLLPGRVLLILSGCGFFVCTLLFALAPANANFWAYIFPAMIGSTLGVDIAFIVTNVFITTNVARERQGIAGALINSLLFVGISFFLGLADLAVAEDTHRGGTLGHKVAFWFAVACSAVTLIIFATIRLGKAESELTVEEKMRREAAVTRQKPLQKAESEPPQQEV
ncbi:hypothetical protein VTJ49DRAFT_5386 [Mycothermus thermophilus]|uniref:Major facilitator superfamily (MFS) profile domain-containing protein n=1 Tax=Humicola insolens TaxID=85995 RepID=A0ABR3V3E8_HUMIN